ncbi:MAG: DUF4097 family beta strand repeat protein [Lachnospiraceae bacterium]|nr:DUF4097 family beta strand repeat protein [Lachnospiraceae bacterium]
MKKFNNVLLIIALIFVIIGNLLYWGAKLIKHINREDYNKNIGNATYDVNGEVDSVNINVQSVDVVITAADSFGCRFENVDTSTSNAYIKDNTLFIEAKNKENMDILGWNVGNCIDPGTKAKVYVYIPAKELKNFKIDMGAGNLNADSILSDNMVIQVGIGSIYINKLSAKNSGALQIGGGKVKIYDLDARDISLKSGIGCMNVTMSRPAGDFLVTTKVSVGKLNMYNGWRLGIKAELSSDTNGNKKVNITNGVGCITVQ